MKIALVLTVAHIFVAISLYAQWANTTYYNQNGSYGGSAQTTQMGKSSRTTFYNANGSIGGNAYTYRSGNSTQTTFYNPNGSMGGLCADISEWQYS